MSNELEDVEASCLFTTWGPCNRRQAVHRLLLIIVHWSAVESLEENTVAIS